MKKLCLALFAIAAVLVCAVPVAAHADTTYDVTGNFSDVAGSPLTGTYTISSAGAVTAADLTILGISFTNITGDELPGSGLNFTLASVYSVTNPTDSIQLAIYDLSTVCSIGNEPCTVTFAPDVSFPDFTSAFVSPQQLNLISGSASLETTATPEPSSLLLLGTGLLGLAFVAFRRAKPSGMVLHS